MNHITENNHSDRQLVRNVLSGDSQSFEQIIKNTEGLVAQIVFKLITNPEDRRDISQDVYLKVYRNLSGFKFQSKLSTWIAQIAYNTCYDYLAKKKLVFHDKLYNDDGTEKEVDAGNWHPGIENWAETLIFQKQQAKILKTEIEKLSPLYKTLITLFHNEHLSYDEIGVITGLPDGTVKNYLFRARRILKNNLLLKYKKEEL